MLRLHVYLTVLSYYNWQLVTVTSLIGGIRDEKLNNLLLQVMLCNPKTRERQFKQRIKTGCLMIEINIYYNIIKFWSESLSFTPLSPMCLYTSSMLGEVEDLLLSRVNSQPVVKSY